MGTAFAAGARRRRVGRRGCWTAEPASLSIRNRGFVDAPLVSAPAIRSAAEHVRAFADPLRRREPAAFDAWLETAPAAGLGGFAAGLRQVHAAVRAAVAEPWSIGPVDGRIGRLKPVKRQVSGRAQFDLLRQRVPHAAQHEPTRDGGAAVRPPPQNEWMNPPHTPAVASRIRSLRR